MDYSKWNVEKDEGEWVAWEPMADPDAGGLCDGHGFPRWREAITYAFRRAQLEQS